MNRTLVVALLVGMSATRAWPGEGGFQFPSSLPELHVSTCRTPPVVDGRLSDGCWRTAPLVENFYVFPLTGQLSDKSRFRVVHDGRWLYFGFTCVNPTLKHLPQTVSERNGSVARDDSVEIFVGPGEHASVWYYQFLLSSANVQADRLKPKRGRKRSDWQAPWRSATEITPDGWTAEVAIPLAVVGADADLKNLRLNITRNLHEALLDDMGAKIDQRLTHSTWAPMQNSFNEAHHLGYVRGLSNAALRPMFLPCIEGASVGHYRLADGVRSYPVTVQLVNPSGANGAAIIDVEDAPSEGQVRRATRTVKVSGKGRETVSIDMPVASICERKVRVRLRIPDSEDILQEYVVKDTSALEFLRGPLPDRTYYTTEDSAQLRCTFRGSEALLRDTLVTLKDSGDKALGPPAQAAPTLTLTVPMSKFGVGTHVLNVDVSSTQGHPLTQRTVTLRKRPPKPGCEVKVDRFSRVILRDGKPFFPFGLIAEIRDSDTEAFRQMADAGFNTLVNWIGSWTIPGSYPELSRKWTDAAAQHGLQVIQVGDRGRALFSKYHTVKGKPSEKIQARLGKELSDQLPGLRETIQAVRDSRNLLAYTSIDEPNLGNWDIMLPACEFFRKHLEELDGYHPVWGLYARHIPEGERATEIADVLAYDVYVYPGWAPWWSSPNFMSKHISKLRARADRSGKVTLAVPMAEGLDPKRCPRILTAAEQNCQTYLALIHGAKGLLYFVSSRLYAASSWRNLSNLAGEMEVLGPAIVAPEVAQEVSYSPDAFDMDREVFPDVQAALFRRPEGGCLLLAANSNPRAVSVTYSVSGLDDTGEGRDVFDRATCRRTGNTFAETLDGYAVRAYRLHMLEPLLEPVQISVRSERSGGGPPAMKVFDPGKNVAPRKNIAANPSFEDMTMPGLPDYHKPTYYKQIPPRVGSPGACWAVDSELPWHGATCLRMSYGRRRDGHPICSRTVSVCYPPKRPDTPYVFSLYLRAAEAGTKVFVAVQDWKNTGSQYEPKKVFALTTDWRRYSLSGEFRPWSSPWLQARNVYVGICTRGLADHESPVIWVDAMQMEKGTVPSPFTTD